MKIVIDLRVNKNFSPIVYNFLEQLCFDLFKIQPLFECIFLRNDNASINALSENIFFKKIKRSGINWLNQKRLLKTINEYKADKYITLHDYGLSVISPVKKKFERKNLLHAVVRIVFSEYYELHLQRLGNTKDFIYVIKPVAQSNGSLSWAEKESIKTQYAGGRDFFLFTGDINAQHQLLELLKAFSSFKKWQQSNMQLVIAGYSTVWTTLFEEKLSTYKYKDDVVLLKDVGLIETARIVSASYAIVYPATENILPVALMQAIQYGTAIIASDNPVNRQLTDAAVWVDNDNLQDGFAKAMILLYKDENQKQLLVQKINDEAKQFNRQQMLEQVWQCITKMTI